MKIRTTTLPALAATLLLPATLFAADEPAPAEAKAAAARAAKADLSCEPSARSRIRKARSLGCNDAQPTRSYSREDLQSTGQFDSAEALRRLDPRFQ
ncbi:MAG: hypothetical protein EOP08_10655 [Proteobacteria bacterium]|nr:MAG: hypothetical protein EOP08_10655 [Pseudomonadota bacterium]